MLQYAWFLSCLALLVLWAVAYLLTGRRREMLTVSLATSIFGVTEPLFVPSYWVPPSLFDLAARTRFDIESFLFSFAIGGIALVLYDLVFGTRSVPVPPQEQMATRHRFHKLALATPLIVFALLSIATRWNPIYTGSLALLAGAIATALCRPDLAVRTVVGGLLFLGLYFVFFLGVNAVFPQFVEVAWKLDAISGIMIAGIPIEELMFALTFGMMWTSFYHHYTWHRMAPGHAAH